VLELREQHGLRLSPRKEPQLPEGSEPEGSIRIRVARPALPAIERYVDILQDVWERGTLSNDGPCTRAFEQAFADYRRGGGHVVAASSGDLSLTLSLAALELPRGARALLPSFGFPSTLHALEWNGLQPRFVDVDESDWCLHADQLDGELNGVSVIVATHMFGAPCDVTGLEELAARTGIALVFDAAQAAGSWIDGRHVTDFGDASVVSFSATKIVTAGEGAIAVLRSQRCAARFRRMRAYGIDGSGCSELLGLNAKLSELHAGLGILTLAELEEQVASRMRLIDRYRERLAARSDLAFQQVQAGARPTPSFVVVDLGDARDAVRAALAARGIESRPYFPAMHHMPRCAEVPRSALPVTDRLGRGLLALPLYSELELSTVEDVCDVVASTLDGFQVADSDGK
jgi:dTDP-4-amino-4,6-dideoxygalactose transaminase